MSTDRAVTDDAQLLPRISKELAALLIQPPRWQEAFFSGIPRSNRIASASTSSATERVLEYGALNTGDAAFAGSAQVDLVGADAETADSHELLRVIEDLFGQLSARANADEVSISDLFLELGFRQRTCEVLDAGVARRLEDVDSRLVDAFEKKELDLALIERSLAHLRKPASRRKWQEVVNRC